MKKIASVAAVILAVFSAACAPREEAVAPTPVFELTAPGGDYKLDLTHASAAFSVRHLGLSDYVARFTEFDVKLTLNRDDLSLSSVMATINPASIRTDYSGDYKATHPKSVFESWDEDLAMSDKFLNAGAHPEIKFVSTAVKDLGGGKLAVTGDLTLLGQTRPVTLDTQILGSLAAHPFSKTGALGLSASTTFKRSDFGMDYLVKPGFVGDDVTLMFNGEFHQIVPR